MGTVDGGRGALKACRSLRTLIRSWRPDLASRGLPATKSTG
jgi:hypothetical protein